ncbi:hypothetical protein AB1K54_12420 [Microbacterium sp. BWT-B31]|uniref:hypothetical protein n=1 Tax=Microbacterium sp. BWT-B31 TaxID=3232072 RepID=UPI0035276A18
MVSDAVTPGRRLAGLRLPRRARPADTADVTSVADGRGSADRLAIDRETLRRNYQEERQREAREREFERRRRLHL